MVVNSDINIIIHKNKMKNLNTPYTKETIQNLLNIYSYLTLADIEEELLESHFDKTFVKIIVLKLEIILTNHQPLIIETFNGISE